MSHPEDILFTSNNSTSFSHSASTFWHQETLDISDEAIPLILRKLKQAVFLDSGNNQEPQTKRSFNIISGEPLATIKDCKNKDTIKDIEKLARQISPTPNNIKRLPFVGGLLGFVSYDYGEQSILDNNTPEKAQVYSTNNICNVPTLYIGVYTWSLVKDITENTYYLTFSPLCQDETRTYILNIIDQAKKQHSNKPIQLEEIEWKKSINEHIYSERLSKIESYISQGDCYQVNFAQRFYAKAHTDALDYYIDRRQKTLTPYSCFIQFDSKSHLLSFSPEQFIGINQRRIETKPIKGTIENSSTSDNRKILINSSKDKAENLMIVDLLRNDLSRVCELNSVKVDKLFSLETFKNVHHLVSHISGILKPDVSELDAFFSAFPGGSITGAPKKRAMEIIKELESTPRGAYCGSVFYLNHDGRFDSNILIRTIIHSNSNFECWGGGGITADSDIKSEYKESLVKVANLTGISD